MRRARLSAERLADELLARAGVPAAGPVAVFGLAERLGASVAESPNMAQDGRLVPQGETAVILVKKGQPRARHRFTVGHELAHWALRSPALAGPVATAAREAFRSEEVLANTVAGALLMPRPWLQHRFPEARDRRYHDLRTLQRIAAAADVSLGAAIVRVRDVFGWNRTLLQWVHEAGAWEFGAEAGLYPWEEGLVMPCEGTRWALQSAAATGPVTKHVRLPLQLGDAPTVLDAEILPRRRDAVTLVSLPRSAA
jgi:hypothetical protein